MSQYNLNPFNRSPYNTQPELNVNWMRAEFAEKVEGSFGSAFENFLSLIFSERVTIQAEPLPVRMGNAAGTETVTQSASANPSYWIKPLDLNENLTGSWELSQIVRPAAAMAENVTCGLEISQEIMTEAVYTEAITGEWAIGKNVDCEAEGFEVVSEIAGAESVSEFVTNLNVTLRPGQILVIDAGNYDILIDGENAIDIHSGDWLDNLNRDTMNITIQAASGGAGLEATMLYTERYL